jgi:hypothetical protein
MVQVDAALDAVTTSDPANINIQGALSFRPMIRTAPLIRSRYLDSMVQNVAQTVVIPPFATGILPVQMSSLTGIVQLDFYDTTNTIRYSLQVSNAAQVTPIPLTTDMVKLVVTSTQAATQHVRLPFELSI